MAAKTMTVGRLVGWSRIMLGVSIAFALLIAMVGVTVDVGVTGAGRGYALPAGLDYSAPQPGALAPLTAPYVSEVLGSYTTARVLGAIRERTGSGSSPASGPVGDIVEHDATNDDVANAYEISSVPFAAKTKTGDASRENDETRACSPAGTSVWYRYAASQAGGMVASTAGSDYAIALGVFSGSPTRGLNAVACDTDPNGSAAASFPAVAGVVYYFQIAGPLNGGNLTFTLTSTPTTSLVSAGLDDRAGNGGSDRATVSATGRYVAFYGSAANFDKRCPCGTQVWVRDLATGHTEMASVSNDGKVGSNISVEPDISADGRYVVFHSLADNLVPGDTNGVSDVFVRDMVARRTERVSVTSSGGQANGYWSHISATGRYVIFTSDAEELSGPRTRHRKDIYRHDRVTGHTQVVSVASDGTVSNHDSTFSDLSPDGRFAIFWSRASNLVPGITAVTDDVLNAIDDYHGHIFVHDLETRQTTAECVAADGTPANDECSPSGALSWGGRYSVFYSLATNLVPGPQLPTGANQILHVYRRDRISGAIERLSVSPSGQPAGDPRQRSAQHVVAGPIQDRWISMSWDGRFIAFESAAPDLVRDDTNGRVDIFFRDRLLDRTTRLSLGSTGLQADGDSSFPMMSSDGRVVVFSTDATNFNVADRNGLRDIYART